MKRILITHCLSIITVGALFVILAACSPPDTTTESINKVSGNYEDLLALFQEFRDFQAPAIMNGVPDYTANAMAAQWAGLKNFQNRLAAMDISTWPISQQVDYQIVRAEMNGMEFNHRVLRPWSRDPCFYLQSQAGAGPVIFGAVRIPRDLPMEADRLARFTTQIQALPEILNQAKDNLTEGAKDLTTIAIWSAQEEAEEYQALADWVKDYHPELVEDVHRAQAAVEEYGRWLEENKHRMTAPSGVGKEN